MKIFYSCTADMILSKKFVVVTIFFLVAIKERFVKKTKFKYPSYLPPRTIIYICVS